MTDTTDTTEATVTEADRIAALEAHLAKLSDGLSAEQGNKERERAAIEAQTLPSAPRVHPDSYNGEMIGFRTTSARSARRRTRRGPRRTTSSSSGSHPTWRFLSVSAASLRSASPSWRRVTRPLSLISGPSSASCARSARS